jgi:hypothetical protein
MENRLPPMVLAQPAGFQRRAARLILAFHMSNKNFLQSCQAFREIGKDFGGDFALIATRSEDARNQEPVWSFRVQCEIGPLRGPMESMTEQRSRASMTAEQSIFKDF